MQKQEQISQQSQHSSFFKDFYKSTYNNASSSKKENVTSFIPKGYEFILSKSKIGFITRNLILTLLFACIYTIVLRWNNNKTPMWKAAYFSLITQTTLGYDWMLPKKPIYYFVNSLQLLAMWSMIIFQFVY